MRVRNFATAPASAPAAAAPSRSFHASWSVFSDPAGSEFSVPCPVPVPSAWSAFCVADRNRVSLLEICGMGFSAPRRGPFHNHSPRPSSAATQEQLHAPSTTGTRIPTSKSPPVNLFCDRSNRRDLSIPDCYVAPATRFSSPINDGTVLDQKIVGHTRTFLQRQDAPL